MSMILATVLFPKPSMKSVEFIEAFRDKILPIMVPSECIIMDNLGARSSCFHHARQVGQLVADIDGEICFTPPYHPFLDPAELAIGWVKGQLEALAEREGPAASYGDLRRHLKRVHEGMTKRLIQGWFAYRGTTRSIEEEVFMPLRRQAAI